MTEIVMPRLSDSMEEGTIIRWLKASGDAVARGDELVEIETDKATMTYESDAAGTLEILAQDGETLPVGSPIARLGDGTAPTPAAAAAPVAPPVAVAPETQSAAPEVTVAGPVADAPAGERVKASPVARRIARERGIDLSSLTGSGPGGRIVKGDVKRAGVDAPAPAPAAPAVSSAPPAVATASGKGEVTTTELTRTQSLIARRMAESRATVPTFTLRATFDMTSCVQLRQELKAARTEEQGPLPSFNDLVVKACAIALAEHPRANGAYKDATFEHYSRVNVGVAVAAQDTLVVPTIFDADIKGLAQIARRRGPSPSAFARARSRRRSSAARRSPSATSACSGCGPSRRSSTAPRRRSCPSAPWNRAPRCMTARS